MLRVYLENYLTNYRQSLKIRKRNHAFQKLRIKIVGSKRGIHKARKFKENEAQHVSIKIPDTPSSNFKYCAGEHVVLSDSF